MIIKSKIDDTQGNRKCRLLSDRNETVNQIMSDCSKLARKEYKARHDWLGKVNYRELCK